jgi:hypothetical protein
VTIAGVLRFAKGTGRLPVVILVQGSGGFNTNSDVWDRQFDAMGVSTFAMDPFAGRGITSINPSLWGPSRERRQIHLDRHERACRHSHRTSPLPPEPSTNINQDY